MTVKEVIEANRKGPDALKAEWDRVERAFGDMQYADGMAFSFEPRRDLERFLFENRGEIYDLLFAKG